MKLTMTTGLLALAGLLAPPASPAPVAMGTKQFTSLFPIDDDWTFSEDGDNDFFPLNDGHFVILEGELGGELTHLEITALDEVKTIGGIDCRVVEEVELIDDELVEISRNYFAVCEQTQDVFYFGEDVDIYDNGVIVSHAGSWLAYSNGATPGIIMPGRILLGSRYYQEVAIGVAEDRAEVTEYPEKARTPAGTFTGCVKMEESTPLEPGHFGYKTYAPEIGLVRDGHLKLIAWGD